MDRERPRPKIFKNPKSRAHRTDEKTEKQNCVAGDAAMEKFHLLELGQLNISIAGRIKVAAIRKGRKQ